MFTDSWLRISCVLMKFVVLILRGVGHAKLQPSISLLKLIRRLSSAFQALE
jgi:hypothetical protein